MLGVKDANKEMLEKDELEDAVFCYKYKEIKEEMSKCEKLKDVMNEDLSKVAGIHGGERRGKCEDGVQDKDEDGQQSQGKL